MGGWVGGWVPPAAPLLLLPLPACLGLQPCCYRALLAASSRWPASLSVPRCSCWLLQTALKTLITLHRLMRETEPTFMDEMARYRWEAWRY